MNIPKQVKTRSVVILLACMLVVSSVSVYYAFSASTPTSGLTDIYIEPPMMESSYIIGIYTAPSTCYLKNGTDGDIETTGNFYTCLDIAIDLLSLPAGGNGGKILIRGGSYTLTFPITITSGDIWIEGEGIGVTTINYDLATGYGAMFYYGLDTWHFFGGIKNILFNGNASAMTSTYAISIQGFFSDLTFQDCLFSHFDSAVLLQAFGSSGQSKIWNIWFQRCMFEDNMNYGIYFTNANDPTLRMIDRVKISECHFYGNKNSIYSNTAHVWHVTFTDNTVQAEKQACINISGGGRQWIITDNHIFDCGIGANGTMAAIMVNGTGTLYPDSWLIENNIIANHFTSAPVALNNSVWLTGTVRNFAIQGNFFYVASEAVRLSGLSFTVDPILVIQNNVGDNSTRAGNSECDVLVGYDGANYYAVNTSRNSIILLSSNASAVIDVCIATNTTILFKEGTYTINTLLPVDVSNIHFVGSGWGTQFTIGAAGGFNISSATALADISFENIYWMDAGGTGVAVATYGITSAMPATMRINHFTFAGCRVDYFRKSGTIFLNLTNAEVSTIRNNFFFRTTTAFIQLLGNLYQGGNIRIYDNVFYGGYDADYENAIRITSLAGNSGQNSAAGEVYSWGNQWYGQHNDYGGTFLAWNQTITATYGEVGGIYSHNDRYENVMVLNSTGLSNTYRAIGGIFDGNSITSQNKTVVFGLGDFTYNTIITNNYVTLQSLSTFIVDDYDVNYLPNSIHGNIFGNTITYFNASSYTEVYDNTNCNPHGYIANWKAAGAKVSPYDGYASTFTNETTYAVSTCPVQFNVTAGTGINGASGVNITICDADGNAFINNVATLFWFYMPIGYTITCVYATSPTVTVIFD